MKFQLHLLILLFAALIIFAGCKKSSNYQPYLKATVNGITFAADGVTCSHDTTGGSSYLVISGTKGIGTVTISIVHFTNTPGTYDITLSTASGSIQFDRSSYAVSGAINVTSLSPVTGTFHFVCVDSTNVTNGAFSCSLQ